MACMGDANAAVYDRLRDPGRWLAFNENGKMWRCIQDWFSKVASLSRASDMFCEAVCEEGIVATMHEVLDNEQVRQAHARNHKVKEVVSCGLSVIISAAKLRNSSKWFKEVAMTELIRFYVRSKDINIRGLAILALANLTPRDSKVGILDTRCTGSQGPLVICVTLCYRKM